MPKESQRFRDGNGYMQIKGNPISKVGVFPYLGSEIPGAPEPDKIYYVYRPAEELARQETIDSFKLMPFIDDHEILGDSGMPAERKGIQGSIGEQVYFDAPYLRGNIMIHSSSAQSLINNGKTELSPCYACKWVPGDGEFEGQPYQYTQREIVANHLALVDEGRTGPDVAVQDSRTFSLDSAELLPMEFTPEQLAQIQQMIAEAVAKAMQGPTAGDEDPVKESTDADPEATDADPVEVPAEPVVTAEQGDAAEEAVTAAEAAQEAIAEVSAAIEEVAAASEEVVAAADSKKRVAAMDKLTKAKGKLSAAKAKSTRLAADAKVKRQLAKDGALAAQVAKLTKKIEQMERAPAKDSATFLGEVADRDQLAKRVSNFTGAFDSSRMTSKQVAEYAVDKLSIKCAKGTEAIALDAWLQGRKPEHETVHATDSKVGDALAQWGKK